jgi:tol-pal system protein YbgF
MMTTETRASAPSLTRRLLFIPILALAWTLSDAQAQLRSDALLTPRPQAVLGGSATAEVPENDVAYRLERLERMLNEKSLSDLVLQLQQLQQEVQQLRGQVELHQYHLRQSGRSLPPLGQSYAERQRAEEAAGEQAEPLAEGEAPDTALAPAADAGAEPPPVPVAPPPKTGVGALGAGSDSGGTLALPSPETLEGGERDIYREAFEHLKDRNYAAAKQEFSTMLVRYPQGQFADNGVFWLGEIGYVTKDYAAALTHFNRLISDYPGSPKVPSAMLKLGYIHLEQQDTVQARGMLQSVSERFPETTEGRLAKGRLEQMTREGG